MLSESAVSLAEPSASDKMLVGQRAMSASEAGQYLTARAGFAKPIPKEQMWKYARDGVLPHRRLGRKVWFYAHELDAVIANNGLPYELFAKMHNSEAHHG